jgi:hypothetical protein
MVSRPRDRERVQTTLNGSRRVGFLARGAQFTCRHGHRIRGVGVIREDVGLRCLHRAKRGGPECGALLYVLVMPAIGGKRRFWAADVEPAELYHFESQEFTVDQVLAYFGAGFPEKRVG